MDGPSRLGFVQGRQDPCLVGRESSGFSSSLGRAKGTPLNLRQEAQGPFPVATGILGCLSVFKRSQATSPFEALNSAWLSSFPRDVRPPVEMRRGTRAFARVATGVQTSLHLERCKTSLHSNHCMGNQALFHVRASRCPFHLRLQNQGPPHTHIAERSVLVRCLS